jgi:putative flippase GtrA
MDSINDPVLIVIPAYQPSHALIDLVDELLARGAAQVVVVNDGSGRAFAASFERLAERPDTRVLDHAVNQGKGAALKTAFKYVLAEFPKSPGVVTADADGQHHAVDILRVADALRANPSHLVLGVRQFEESVPWKSRLGNLLTRTLVQWILGQKLSDTQTGLRGIPAALIPHLLHLPSRGYEFELDMLIACKHEAYPILEEPIRTIYLDENKGSHFRPVVDSMRIYFLLFRFASLSLVTALLDNLVFASVLSLGGSIGGSQITARLCSIAFNYVLARRAVFHSQQRHAIVFPKYVLVVAGNGALSYALIRWLHGGLGWPVIPAKLLAEGSLFVASFLLQRDFVFTRHGLTQRRDRAKPA